MSTTAVANRTYKGSESREFSSSQALGERENVVSGKLQSPDPPSSSQAILDPGLYPSRYNECFLLKIIPERV
jgi:hypothetical protein